MDPTPTEATRLLANADALRGQVKHNAARESRAFLGWGVYALVMIPPFDLVDHNIWGPILTVVALAGTLVTTRYYQQRAGRVRLLGSRRWSLVWIPWGVCYGGLVVMAELLQSQVGFIWTAAAVGAALPLLATGIHLLGEGR